MDTQKTDVTVVGAGMGGLVAATRALELGADVLLVEKAPRPGGSMYLSGGHVWTHESAEKAAEIAPNGNWALQRLVVESLDDDLEWLDEQGATLKALVSDLPRGKRIEPPEFTETMIDRIEALGGEIRLQSPMANLKLDEGGRVSEVVVDAATDGRRSVETDAVVLATGGFQGNEQLVEAHITENTENLWLRSNPWSTGDGFLSALDVGAKTTSGMSLFYGHNVAAPPANFSTSSLADVTQYYGPEAVAIDAEGNRFTDESDAPMEVALAQDTAKLTDGRAFYVLDADIYEMETTTGRRPAPFVEGARNAGGNVAEEESLAALGRTLSGWGVDGRSAVATIEEYNEAIRTGETDRLTPTRAGNHNLIDEPPYYAVAVQPGITFSVGGLDVSVDAEVYRRSSTVSSLNQHPDDPRTLTFDTIDGLYAAGADVGNINHRHYVGGLAAALVTGKTAGANAAEYSLGCPGE